MADKAQAEVNGIAKEAEEIVTRITGDANTHWAKVFREYAQDPELKRWDLHGMLRNASDSYFGHGEVDLSKRLSELCSHLDRLAK